MGSVPSENVSKSRAPRPRSQRVFTSAGRFRRARGCACLDVCRRVIYRSMLVTLRARELCAWTCASLPVLLRYVPHRLMESRPRLMDPAKRCMTSSHVSSVTSSCLRAFAVSRIFLLLSDTRRLKQGSTRKGAQSESSCFLQIYGQKRVRSQPRSECQEG